MPGTSKSPKKLSTYICGDGGPLDDFNPSVVTRQKLAPEILYLLNRHPLDVKQICSELKISKEEIAKLLESLIRIKAIEEKSGVYHVTFPIFTKDDLTVLTRVSKQIGAELAKRICNHEKEITSLAQNFSSTQQIHICKLLFAVVGCFVLDWQGLKALEDEGLLVKNKRQPGNRSYLLFAREEVNENMAMRLYDGLFWGSHSDTFDENVFTSFGDHTGWRYAFPDILWNTHASLKTFKETLRPPLWLAEKLSKIISLCGEFLLKDVSSILFEISKEGPLKEKKIKGHENEAQLRSLLHLLEDMNYVAYEKGIVKLNYPVFLKEDKEIIKELGDLIIPLAVQTIKLNHNRIKQDLSEITPMKNNIPFGEILNEVWHWIFAQTNKILAEKGFLYNPQRSRPKEARYIAWISQFSYP